MTNPILEELHDIRRAILAEHKDDLTEYLHAAFVQTLAVGHPLAKIKQRKIQRAGVQKPDRVVVGNPSSAPRDR